jgi:acyl-CoA synthetase (NDP forming)/GNAT superfamily N-acetyltransferase
MSTVDAGSTNDVAAYPAAWEFDSLLTDGTAVCVRPVTPSDAAMLVTFHAALSPQTIYRRYFGAHPLLTHDEAEHYANVDYRERMCFLAVVADRLVGFASYDRLSPDDPAAEIAFCVADEVQHHGVATLLLETLAAYARRLGIWHFVADVLADNAAMLDVFETTGLDSTRTLEDGTASIDLDLTSTPRYVAACDEREAVAEAASVTAILRPRSVAVVGAGRERGNAGYEMLRSLLGGEFVGRVYPVNPNAVEVCGVPTHHSLSSLPEPVDLAIVAVRPELVQQIVGEGAATGVRSMLIVTAAFAETGDAGGTIESEILAVARRHGMRIVGPNCLGVINTDPAISLNATFADLDVVPGHLAVVSQSGTLGIAVTEQARRAGLGLSSLVSLGNKLDVSSNDVLCYLERDAATSVIALYLESFGNARKFARIARRVGRQKPIVALTAGRSSSGARGARSRTAAAATPDVMVSALLNTSGVIKVDHLEELVDVSSVLLSGNLPSGTRVALVGNSGGPLILAADACENSGLLVPELGEVTKSLLRAVADTEAAVSNPIDLTADGTGEQLVHALDLVAADDAIDAIVVVATALPALRGAAIRRAVGQMARSTSKPVVLCLLGEARPAVKASRYATIPTPERAAAAVAHACRYAEWRRNEESAEPARSAAIASNAILTSVLKEHPAGGWLELDTAAHLLTACGLPIVATYGASSADEAADLAQSIGYPVVLKARSGEIVHKSDVGAVAIGLASAGAVRVAYELMSARLGETMGGAVVQPMATGGIEAIVGTVTDANFGPLVMVELGTELLGDRAFLVPPFGADAVESLLGTLHSAPLLNGYRGAPAIDRGALVRLIELVGVLADQVSELAELDLNPVVLSPEGALVLDCKVRLGPARTGPGPLFRALRARR